MTPWTPEQITQASQMAQQGKPAREIAEALGRTIPSVHALSRRGAISLISHGGKTTIPTPADFAAQWAVMGQTALCKHYSRSQKTIRAWVAELGLERPKGPNLRAGIRAPRASRAKPHTTTRMVPHRAFKPSSATAYREDSIAADAARYLQGPQGGYTPVFRSDATGKEPNTRGRFWRCGRLVLTDAQIIARAGEVRCRRERRVGA